MKQKKSRINADITNVSQVRLINAEGEQAGIVSLEDALESAKSVSLDLVEISPDAEPPVCRIMDYRKFLFERKKQKTVAKKKQKQFKVKEVKFRPNTDIGDYGVKLRNLMSFLDQGNKVKVTLRFRGREMAHQDLGLKLLKRVEADVLENELGSIELAPKLEGRQITMVIAPKKA